MFELGFVVCERMKSLISLLILLILLPLCKSSSTLSPSLNDDVLGLMVFKADIRDPTGKLSSWNEDDDSPCNWDGIKCNPRSNRVSELNLDGFSLSGKLGRGLLQLQALMKLSLSNNNLTGSVIPALVRLPNLRILDLSDNIFTGALPNDFFRQCGPLRTVNFGNNKFSGQIPESLNSCVGITVLNLSANQFSGGIHYGIWGLQGLRSLDLSYNMLSDDIPESMDGLINLMTFNLSKNQLTGLIPGDIGECSLLKSVDFSGNLLSGNLPVSLLNLSSIGYLNVGGNSLVGQVPRWIGGMIGLEYLDLSANNFSNVLPNSLGKLRSLKVLNMSLNSLSGSLPESMVGCVSLQVIDFRQNLLNGYLPKWVFKVALQEILFSENKIGGVMGDALLLAEKISHDSLEVLDLSHNALTGAIPLALSNFSSLKFLNLSKNLLTGPIPKNIGELRALNILDLSQNKLKGSIPSEIGKAVALQELVLGKNFIEGIIPTSIDHCSSLSVLILSHNSLEGPIPLAISKLTGLQIVDLSSNNLIGTMPKQLENLQHLLSFNVSHNNLQGELPGGFFNTISPSSVLDNPSLCGSATKRSCSAVLPKPIVLNPNSTGDAFSSSSLPSTLGRKRNLLSISSLIAIGAAAVIIIGVIAITVLNLRVRASTSRSATALALSNGDDFSYSPSMDANSGKLVIFSGEPDFSTRTHTLLNKDCELGRGGFGAVYQTVLQNGCPVAIKKLTVSSLVKPQEDFEREVKKLGKIRHSNLVTLEGYYWTPSLQLLIYEFISGGSLHKYLHEGGENFLSWNDRFNIIVGMAKGLSHLHQLGVIHYNLKSSNILIDGLGEPKVGDFGLVRLLPMLDRYILSSKIQSALGYMAPEFACQTVKITEKCDVYGFGVLVLELVTGKRPVEYMEDDVVVLCDMVRGALDEGKVEECVDERLQGRFPAEETIPVMKLGLICTSQVPSNRPDMIEVVNILEFIRCPEGQEDSG